MHIGKMVYKDTIEEQELIAFETEQHKVQVVEQTDEHGQVCNIRCIVQAAMHMLLGDTDPPCLDHGVQDVFVHVFNTFVENMVWAEAKAANFTENKKEGTCRSFSTLLYQIRDAAVIAKHNNEPYRRVKIPCFRWGVKPDGSDIIASVVINVKPVENNSKKALSWETLVKTNKADVYIEGQQQKLCMVRVHICCCIMCATNA